MSGRSLCRTSGSFTSASPTLSTIAASSSPLTMVWSLELILATIDNEGKRHARDRKQQRKGERRRERGLHPVTSTGS
ncbi:hypothetical protein EYF80_025403 [Liparis tanakae]|uniref:Uncharacterized protein n=1 Tax=Liparis tanakae TaxID=230148 RepID=A0A4Z2HHQ2_9TELE|nr:hypothetical protein EYF80_025403 [Liparis tanakae]